MAQNEYIKCMEYSFQSKYMKISNVKYRILSRRIWNTSCQLYIPLRHRSSRIHSTTREDQAWDPLHCKVPATLRFGAVVLCACLGCWLMTGEVRMRDWPECVHYSPGRRCGRRCTGRSSPPRPWGGRTEGSGSVRTASLPTLTCPPLGWCGDNQSEGLVSFKVSCSEKMKIITEII